MKPDLFSEPRRCLRLLFTVLFGALVLTDDGQLRAADTLISIGSTWRYLDNGSDAGTAWRGTNFNDSSWPFGPTQLGFGDGDESQLVSGGPSGARFPATYFRNTFVVTNRASITNVALRLMRDDGGIVYLNGVEIFRSNMPDAPAAYNTWAALSVSGSEESTFFAAPVPLALLQSGTNVMAVEIHQDSPSSSDLSFNLELLANTLLGNLPPVPTPTISPSGGIFATGEVFTINVTASDPETFVTRIDVMQDGSTIRTFFASAGSFTWSNVVTGIHEFTARATDSAGVTGTSVPVRVLITPPGLQAQSVFFPQFSSANGLILQSDATTSSNVLHLMRLTSSGRGASWMATQQGVPSGFSTEFRFRITSKVGGGADGFAFVISGTPQPAIGNSGIGYGGITNSLAVEFDTWNNSSDSDPDDHHIGIHTRGPLANSQDQSAAIGIYTPPTDYSDGLVHKVKIEYLPGTLRVFLDNLVIPVLTVNVDLSTLLFLPNGNAWIGFTAGSGASSENHDIWAWSYTSFANVPPTVSLTSPAQAIRVAPGTDLTLTAVANDPNGHVIAVDFFDGTQFIGEVTEAPFSITWSNALPGIHVLSADAIDDGGLDSLSAPVVAEILSSNATVILFPDFSDSNNLILQGSAAVVANRVRLTPAAPSQVGGAWLNSKQAVQYGFETVFEFQISQLGGNGADGLAFVILGNPVPILGDSGAGMGYGSIANSLAVEFDTYQNSQAVDPDANHIGVHSRGTTSNTSDESASLGRAVPFINMSDGGVHVALIRYSSGVLRIFLDDLSLPVLSVPLNLGTLLNLENGTGWIGLTSGTGGDYENHDVLMWSFRPNLPPQVQLTPLDAGPFVFPTNIMISADAIDPDGEDIQVDFYVNGNSIGGFASPPFIIPWNPVAGTYLLTARATDDFGAVTTTPLVRLPVFAVPHMDRAVKENNGSITVQFATTSGQNYTVQYSRDLVQWTNALPSINGNGLLMSWHDTGPPATASSPTNESQRFYRVIVSP